MNLNPLPWLRGCLVRPELTQWTAAGLIQPEQEQRIADQYDRECCGVALADWSKLALFALSAIAMLLALTLIVAEHWREIYLPFKISLALIGMALAHGSGYWYRFQMGQERRGDGCFFAGTILYGCVMLLAVDHYYADSLYRTMTFGWVFFAWAAGTLPLAWVLGSRSILSLASALGTIWVVWHIAATGTAKVTSLFVVQELCLLRWSYINRSRGLLILTVLALIVWWIMLTVAEGCGRESYYWIAALGPLLILIGLRHDETHPFAAIYRYLGMGLGVVMLLALTLPSVSRDLMGPGHTLRFWLAVIAAFGGIVAFVPAPRRMDYARDWPAIAALASVTLLPAVLGLIGYAQGLTTAATIVLAAVFNAAAVAVVVGLVLCGGSTSCSGCVAAACAYFALWATLVTIDLRAGAWTSAALIFAVAAAAILVVARLQPRKQVSNHETVSPEGA